MGSEMVPNIGNEEKVPNIGSDELVPTWPARERVAAIRERSEALLHDRAAARFRELVLEWAGSDEGAFPTLEQAHDEARLELEVLCGALGPWAALAPFEVFPAGLISRTRPAPPEEGWW